MDEKGQPTEIGDIIELLDEAVAREQMTRIEALSSCYHAGIIQGRILDREAREAVDAYVAKHKAAQPPGYGKFERVPGSGTVEEVDDPFADKRWDKPDDPEVDEAVDDDSKEV